MSNPGFLSKRVKKKVTSGLTSDRYQFLGLDQAEPDLGDPLVGPSSVGVKPYTGSVNNLYVLVADNTGSGNRYWTPQSSIISGGTVSPGSITVRNKGSIVGSVNQITDLNFVGSGVTVVNPATWVGAGSSSVDIQITVTDLVATGSVGAIQYKNSSGFVVGASDLFYTPSNTFVGIGSTVPTVKLDVIGNLKVSGIATIGTLQINSGIVTAASGIITYYGDGSKLSNISVSYATTAGVSTNVIGGIASVTSLFVSASGISTLGTVKISSGIITATTGVVTYYGDGSNLTNIQASSIVGNIGNTNYATTAGVSTNVIGGIASVTSLFVNTAGISTLGTVKISSGIVTSTNPGVTTVVYYGDGSKLTGNIPNTITNINNNAIYYPVLSQSISGSISSISVSSSSIVFNPGPNYLGIGSASPTTNLDVIGNVKISGVSTIGTVQIGSGIITATSGIITYYGSFVGNITGNVTGNVTGIASTAINALGLSTTSSVNTTGIITASQFSTGSSGIGINTDTISGPSVMYIDPSPVGVGTTSGIVRIKGDLYVDGTQFIVNSTTIELADFQIGIGTTATSDLLLDGAGIGIGSVANRKTFIWEYVNSALKSSENINIASGKTYKIAGTDVLTSTTLGTNVINSSLTSVGTLAQLNVTGVSTLGILTVSHIYSTGIVTATKYFGDGSALTGINTTSTAGYASTAGIATSVVGGIASVTQLQVTGVSTFSNGPVLIGAATSTGTASQTLQVTGSVYIAGDTVNGVGVGIGTTNAAYPLDIRLNGSGAGVPAIRISSLLNTNSAGVLYANAATSNFYTGLLNSSGNLGAIGPLTPYAAIVGTSTALVGGTASPLLLLTNNTERVRVFGTGEVGIGTTAVTGTASQLLQVSGGAYVSGSVGIGTASPAFTADIAGDARVTSTNKMRFGGTSGTTNFYIQYNSTANSLDFVAG